MRTPNPVVRAFTMLELLVAVSLMVMLLSVLTFVFRQSAAAVGGATETVTVVQKARNFAGRMGREVGAAVEHYFENPTPNEPPTLAFRVSDDGKTRQDSGEKVEFIAQTLNEGVLDTWCVRYYYVAEENIGNPEEETGAIMRVVREKDEFPVILSGTVEDELKEVVIRPVRNVRFTRIPPSPPQKTEIDTMPASLSVQAEFLDTWGGTKFKLPLQFYFPVYQGH